MKKKWLMVLAVVALTAALTACGPVELSSSLDTTDGNFTFSVPEGWSEYDGLAEDDLVLHMTDGGVAFAKVYYISYDLYDYSYEKSIKDVTAYYSGSIIGEADELTISEMDASKFEYDMVDLSEEETEVDYHGFEYVINAPKGVLNVDIYYAQDKTIGKIIEPSESELELLQRIVESVEAIG